MLMGEVVATLKIMPESPDVDLEALKAAIQAAMPAEAEFHKIEEEPIAFGLVALNLIFIIEDGEVAVCISIVAFPTLKRVGLNGHIISRAISHELYVLTNLSERHLCSTKVVEFLIVFLHEVVNGIFSSEVAETTIQNLRTELGVLVC